MSELKVNDLSIIQVQGELKDGSEGVIYLQIVENKELSEDIKVILVKKGDPSKVSAKKVLEEVKKSEAEKG